MGTPDFAAQLLGRPLTRPGTYTAEYIQNVIRERESQKGIFFTESIDRAVDDVVTGVEIGAGVLRQGMARKAGAFAEFIVTWLTPREYLRDVIIPSLKVGAEQAGRAAPRVVSVVPFALNRNGRDVLRLMVRSVSHHIKFPHYQAMMNEAGVAMVGNLGADLRAALSSQLFAYGSADDLVSTLREYERIGVDEVILNPASLALREGHAAAIQDLKEAFEIVGSSLAG
jgi:alkanesulfonate monooxygenase SsuD/methylene tetrahydromethanopterin reductase-like flavin-dependent oxidoreductase (luciferase family)